MEMYNKFNTEINSYLNIDSNDKEGKWVGSLVCDIIGYKNLIRRYEPEKVTAIIRMFSNQISKMIDAKKGSLNTKITYAGDAVIVMAQTPRREDVTSLVDLTFWINTLRKHMKKIVQKKLDIHFDFGIGVFVDNENKIIKVGKDQKEWTVIGESIIKAMKSAKTAGRNNRKPILVSNLAYQNIFGSTKDSFNKWGKQSQVLSAGLFWEADIVMSEYKNYIDKL